MAAADLAARDLVDGVRGVAARRLAAGGAQAGGEPRAAPRGGEVLLLVGYSSTSEIRFSSQMNRLIGEL